MHWRVDASHTFLCSMHGHTQARAGECINTTSTRTQLLPAQEASRTAPAGRAQQSRQDYAYGIDVHRMPSQACGRPFMAVMAASIHGQWWNGASQDGRGGGVGRKRLSAEVKQ